MLISVLQSGSDPTAYTIHLTRPDFLPSSYGFRPRRRAQDAIAEIHFLGSPARNYEWVFEGDITACFDEIDHNALMTRVRRRIADKRVLALVKAFLRSGILTEDGNDRATITGTPQGGILSPLLANIALSVLDEYFAAKYAALGPSWTRAKHRRSGGAVYRLVRYADDFVVMVAGTRDDAETLGDEVTEVLAPIGLRLSVAKTRVCHIDEGFDFLGWRIQRRRWRGRTGKRAVYTYPSKQSLLSVMGKVRSLTRRHKHRTLAGLLRMLNPVLRGWCNYFRHGVSSRTFSYLDHFAFWRIVGWLRKRHHGLNWGTLHRRYLPGWEVRDGTRRDGPATNGRNRALPLSGRSHPHTMGEHNDRINRISGMNPWRAGCGESRTSGSEGGPEKPTARKHDRALRSDPYTKLQGPQRGVYYELFVIIDIFSRYVVGWMVSPAETGELAEAFIADTLAVHGIAHNQLTLHADRGTSMTSKPVAQLLVDLGVARSHSRPHVSNDNPYSEANFKTLKYCPTFPGRFGSIEDARVFCTLFFDHYNHVHRHTGIGLHTPASLHYGTATEIHAQHAATLDAAYAANPARFRHRKPHPPKLPTIAWINEPTPQPLIKSA